MKPVAVIGGGITGLTAAYQLKQKGVPVMLLEGSNRVGGVIQSIRRDGYLAEFGPNSILETSSIVTELVKNLGLDSRKTYSDPSAENRYVVRRKKPMAVPSSPLGFLTTPLFSLPAKLRVLLEPFIPASPPEAEESIAEFVTRRLGEEFLDYAIDPLVAGVYAGNPRLISVPQAFPKLHALEQRYHSLFVGQFLGARERKRSGEVSKQNARKLSFDDGLQVLIDALRASLEKEIHCDTQVDLIEQREGGWTIQSCLERFDCGAVFLALPAYKLASLAISSTPKIDVASLARVYYPPVASVVLGFKRSDVAHPLNGFGMLLPQKEGFSILGAIFSSSLFPNRAPDGHVTITCYIGGSRAPELTRESPDNLAKIAAADLETILGVRGKPTFQQVTVFQKAIPQYNVGYAKYKNLMSEMEASAPGLFVGGHARDGVSLSDSIVSGHKNAGRIQSYLKSKKNAEPTVSHFIAA